MLLAQNLYLGYIWKMGEQPILKTKVPPDRNLEEVGTPATISTTKAKRVVTLTLCSPFILFFLSHICQVTLELFLHKCMSAYSYTFH